MITKSFHHRPTIAIQHRTILTIPFQIIQQILTKSATMGCNSSKPEEAQSSQAPKLRTLVDFDANPPSYGDSTATFSAGLDILIHSDLPGYVEYPTSLVDILSTLKIANNNLDNTLPNDAPRSAFNALPSRHQHVWIDNNPRLPRPTMDSVLLAATLLLSLGKAYDCDMEIFFTGFSNQYSKANSNL